MHPLLAAAAAAAAAAGRGSAERLHASLVTTNNEYRPTDSQSQCRRRLLHHVISQWTVSFFSTPFHPLQHWATLPPTGDPYAAGGHDPKICVGRPQYTGVVTRGPRPQKSV